MKNSTSISHILPVLFGFFVMGFCDVVGITATHMKVDFGLSDTLSNMIPVALFSMFLFFSIPTGMLMNKIGRKKTVLLSNLITSMAMLIPLIHYSYGSTLVAFGLLGLGNTILQVALNPLLTNVVKGDRLTSTLTAGQFVKAISSFLGPFLAAFAASRLDNWQYIFPMYALISVIASIWLMATPIQQEELKSSQSSFASVFSILKNKTIFYLFLGIIFVVGVDVGINTASSKLLMERSGLNSIDAGFGPSIYFAFRTAGAFMGAILLTKFSSFRILRISMVIGVAALIALLFSNELLAIGVLVSVIGFAIANVFSILMGLAIRLQPEKANEISSLMITGIIGGAIIPFIMGLTSDALKSQTGSILIILLCAVYLLILAFILKEKKLS